MPTIDPARLLGDLRHLATFGAYETGVHRPTFSEVDMAARHWFAGQLEAAGLDVTVDGIGNILGRSRKPGKAVLVGSHLESQNHAGWLDGALGCVYGLEAARALDADPATRDVPVDVVVLCDEEGHYGSFIGSRSLTGLLEEAEIDRLANRYDGTPLRAALERVGLSGLPRLALERERYAGFLEAHIEQGDRLISAGLKIGVVTAIVAIWQYRIVAEGQQNHAGTTGMARRRDAGLALTRLLGGIDQRFPQIAGADSVWTTGRITLEPGAPSIIPGRAEALFQVRDVEPETLERMQAELFRLAEAASAQGPCPLTVEIVSRSTPAACDTGLLDRLDEAAAIHAPGLARRMPSGAGHDAQYLARVMPAAMLFVPSIGGISHHWSENTDDADLVLGAQVFAQAVALAGQRA